MTDCSRTSGLSFASFFAGTPLAMAVVDSRGMILEVNPALENLLAFPAAELCNQNISRFLPSSGNDRFLSKLLAVPPGESAKREMECVGSDNRSLPVLVSAQPQRGNGHACAILTLEDLREHKAVLERLELATYFDPLTGLANRLLFQSRLEQSLLKAERAGELVALLLLNLNRFKEINNSFSYAAGNALLQEIGNRIGACLRKSDTLARLHGDRFVILLERLTTADPVAMIARKIFRVLASPFVVDGHEVFLTASIGIALFPDDGCSAEGLLKNAETAMYRARERKNNRFQFYTQEMNARTRDRMNLESALYRALERNEFELFYQPQISPLQGTISGVEALLRWRHPQKGILPPLEFIPLLEENGLIVPVGQWVLREACRQARRWHDQGFPSVKMAVNISPRQLQEKDFVPFLQNLLGETGLHPGSLVLELTESCLMHNAEENTLLFTAIAKLGVLIAIDDFGTGFSSLSYLKHLPVHALKIDRCFVQGITENRHDTAIGFAILSLAEKLGLQVTAEGVEKPEQMHLLSSWRCDQVQGFLFAPPMPAPLMLDWLRCELPALAASYFPDAEKQFEQAESEQGNAPEGQGQKIRRGSSST